MLKALMVCLAIASPAFADSTIKFQNIDQATLNQSKIIFSKNTTEDTLVAFFDMGVQEYNYSDFGFAKDIFQAITVKTTKIPSCYLYLGKIYETVAQFKNEGIARQCYLAAATAKNLDVSSRQQSYLALVRLTDDSKLAIRYAKASNDLLNSETAKQSMVLAYQKNYEQTSDETSLNKAESITRQMNAVSYPTVDMQQVNMVQTRP